MNKFLVVCALISSGIINAQRSSILSDNELIFFYDFENFSDGYVTDISANSINGRMDNITNTSSDGYFGNSFEFNENLETGIVIENIPEINPNEVSILAWIYPFTRGKDSKRMEILEKTPDYWLNVRSGNTYPEESGILRGGVFAYEKPNMKYDDAVWEKVDSKDTIPLNKWTHAAFTYNGDSICVYVNGELQGVDTDVNPILRNSEYNLGIGTRPCTDGSFVALWNGKLDEVMVLGRALSTEEINDYYQSVDPSSIPYHMSKGFNLYPNPASTNTTIYTGEQQLNNYTVQILNMAGQVVYSEELVNGYHNIEFSDVEGRGLYLVRLIDENNMIIESKKLIFK
ncbi:MAG: T9SS type A sorting domain-containing protein [Bacteroidales bacterium]|nr:T9SS type A sorting domain-containing protein [Bacteroidales bacterium]